VAGRRWVDTYAKFQGISFDDDGVSLLIFPPGDESVAKVRLTLADQKLILNSLIQSLTDRARTLAGMHAGRAVSETS